MSLESAIMPRMAVLYPFMAIAMMPIDHCGYCYRPRRPGESTDP